MSKCADCNELVGEEWSANNGLCITCARDELSEADTNQASEDIRNHISLSICHEAYSSEYEELTSIAKWTHDTLVDETIMPAINAIIRTEKLKLLDEVIHQSTVNLKSAKAVAGWAELRKQQLEAEL